MPDNISRPASASHRALHWIGTDGAPRTVGYEELRQQVARFADLLILPREAWVRPPVSGFATTAVSDSAKFASD